MRLGCMFFLSMLLLSKTYSQDATLLPCLTLNASKNGIAFSNNNYFSKIGILIQDTCSSFNRFDRNFYPDSGSVNRLPFYKAIIVDSITAISIEDQLKRGVVHRSDNNTEGVSNASEKLRKFIRLYAGFISVDRDTCVVVQYVTKREYKKESYYSKQLDLIAAKNRSLKFVVFEKSIRGWIIRSSFPNDFL